MDQAHVGHRLGQSPGLGRVDRHRPAGVDLAEPARPGALLAIDHEGGRAVAPALVDIGAAGLLAHRDQRERAHGALHVAVRRPEVDLHAQPRGLAGGHRQPCRRLPRPRDVDPFHRAVAPTRRRRVHHGVDDLAHVDGHALGGQRGDALVGDPAWDDPVEPGKVGVNVEGEPVHGPAPGPPDADGADLAGRRPVGIDPDAGRAVDPAQAGQAQAGAHLDHQLLDGPDVLARRVGGGHHRIAHQLARAVPGHVAATVGGYQLRAQVDVAHPQVVERTP